MSSRSRAATIAQLLAALALLGALAGAAPGVALAAPPAIEEVGSPAFPARAYALRTPTEVRLEPGDLTVSENGEPVEAIGVESAARAARGSFGTVLVIDASNSMKGAPIEGAMRAARAFAQRRTPDQRLGVVTFNGKLDVLVPLSSSSPRISRALAATPGLSALTRLHDAIAKALDMLAEEGIEAGSIVVLSDGADNGSEASAPAVAQRAADSGSRVFAVGLRSPRFNPDTLEELVGGGGAVADAASPDQLAAIFDRVAAQLASEHLIRYESGGHPGEAVTVEVEVEGIPGVAVDRYEAPGVAAAVPPEPADRSFWASRGAMLGAVGLVAAMLGAALFLLVRPQRETVRERLARFVRPSGLEDAAERREMTGPPATPFARLERSLALRDWWLRFAETLEIAKIGLSPIHVVALTLIATGLVPILVIALVDAPILSPLALGAPLGARWWIARRLRGQRRNFSEQLADNLQLVASALRAGQSMAAAIAVVVEEAPEPGRGEFRRIVNDERLGVPLEDAMRDVGRRMDNPDMEQVALVATIQRETGGNTAEILDQVIATTRERDKLRRLMETLTAQGRLTQIVISLLPLVLLIGIALINRDYMAPLFETTGGHIALALGAGLSIVGSLIIRRIVAVRV